MSSIENILAVSIISYLFGWPLFALERQEITKKVQLKDNFFLGSQGFMVWYFCELSSKMGDIKR